MKTDQPKRNRTYNFKRNQRTRCRCEKCGEKFMYEERKKKPISFGMTKDVCPYCGGSFTITEFNHDTLKTYVDKYKNLNLNLDPRFYDI